jgi:hypothetical protein
VQQESLEMPLDIQSPYQQQPLDSEDGRGTEDAAMVDEGKGDDDSDEEDDDEDDGFTEFKDAVAAGYVAIENSDLVEDTPIAQDATVAAQNASTSKEPVTTEDEKGKVLIGQKLA